jgi:hypothetical protein
VSRIWRVTPFNVPNKEDGSGLKKSEKDSGDAARAETDVESFLSLSRLDNDLEFEASHSALLDHLRLFCGGNLVANEFGILFDRVAGDDGDPKE